MVIVDTCGVNLSLGVLYHWWLKRQRLCKNLVASTMVVPDLGGSSPMKLRLWFLGANSTKNDFSEIKEPWVETESLYQLCLYVGPEVMIPIYCDCLRAKVAHPPGVETETKQDWPSISSMALTLTHLFDSILGGFQFMGVPLAIIH